MLRLMLISPSMNLLKTLLVKMLMKKMIFLNRKKRKYRNGVWKIENRNNNNEDDDDYTIYY